MPGSIAGPEYRECCLGKSLPRVSGWFGVDPQGQLRSYHSPDIAMGNSSVSMIDPNGEFFGTTIIGLVDLFNTALFKGGLDPTSSSARRNAWKKDNGNSA